MQKEYRTRHDWVGKVIHRELCKKFKFDHTNKCYIQNSKSALANGAYKPFRDFEIQTDRLISARRPDLVIINKIKENLPNSGHCRPGRPQSKNKESGKRDKYLELP